MLEQARLAGYQPIETPDLRGHGRVRPRGRRGHRRRPEGDVHLHRQGRPLPHPAPELTAGIVRALIEHGRLTTGLTKVVCSGPQFRYERPQAGRQRQFTQVDIEAMGSTTRPSTPT
jgi:histidyl-tRNA synthetase